MKKFVFLTILFCTVMKLEAAGTSGAALLKSGVGARAMAVGEAYTTLSDGADSIYWNPARLLESERPTLFVTYSPMLEDAHSSQAAFSFRGRKWAGGFGFNGLNYGSIHSYDDVGNKQADDYSASDLLGVASMAFGGKRLQWGASVKYFKSEIDGVSATALAGDAGMSFRNPFADSWSHALVVRNLGGKISFISQEDPLPFIFTFGNSVRWGKRLTVAVDGSHEKDRGAFVSTGLELGFLSNNFLRLRSGYTTRRNEADKLSGASFGAGFLLKSIHFDYAWVPFGELGDNHVVSIVWEIPEFDWSPRAKSETPRLRNGRRSLGDSKSEPQNRRKRSLGDFDKK